MKLKNTLLLALSFLFFVKPILAGNDLAVTCSQSEEFGFCDTSPANIPLFSETDVKPGFNFYQNITVDTTSLEEEFCNLTIGTSKVSDPSGLGGVLVNQLRRDGSIIKEFTIADLSTPTFLETIPNNSTYIYNWKMTMKENAGNEFQGQNLSFDLLLNFSCGQEPEPTLTPTPVINPSGIILNELMPAPSDNQEWFEIYNTNNFAVILENWQYDDLDAISSGAVRNLPIINIPAFGFYVIQAGGSYFNNGGDFVRLINQDGIEVDSFDYTSYSYIFSWSRQPDNSWCLTDPTKDDANNLCPSDDGPTPTSPPSPPTCDDEKPNTPTGLFATDIGNGQVSLIWNPVVTPPPFTYYLLAYGPSPGNYIYGNPNVGSNNSYIVSGLTTGAQYCFYVKAINNCMPGDPSNESCINIGSTTPILETTPPEGFVEGVLGEETEETEGEVEGLVGGNVEGVSECEKYWLPILYLVAFFINIIYMNRQASKKPYNRSSLRHIVPLLLPVLAFFVDTYILKTRCCKVALWYCKYFWIGNILSLFVPVYYYNKTK